LRSPPDEPTAPSSGQPQVASIVEPHRDKNLVTGCMLTILSGMLSLANGLASVVFESDLSFGTGFGIDRYAACGFIVIVLGAVAILGGFYSLKYRRISFALAGAAMGMAGGGLVGFWCGLGALIALVLSHEDL
jgi:hypothetical protein